jgi:archaellum biogenesis ATPase FlaH
MKKHSNSNPGTIIAYYYFSFDDSGKQTAYNMVSSLVAQICNSITDLPEDLTVLYDRCFALKQHAAMSELRAILKLLASRISVETTTTTKDIFIVIDALDECSKRDEERQETLDVIEDIRSWSLANFHILITSRKEQDIEERVVKLLTEAPISIEGSQVADDIDLFINERIETVSKLQRLPQDLKTEIKDVLRKGANGM